MKSGGGLFSRMKGRANGADPFVAMGQQQRGAALQSSPVGVPVGSAPASGEPAGPAAPVQDGTTGQFAAQPQARTEQQQNAPARGRDAARVADAWGTACEHFALQIVMLAEQLRPALDQLEADEQDAERLDRLYTVDHAVTRIRRAARDLRVLSGKGDDETTGPTSSLVDTIRVALSSIEWHTQVSIGSVAELAVVGYVVDDVASLLAALLDNATRYSQSTVTISGHLVSDGGVMFRIEDTGIGLTGPHIAALNDVLDSDVPDIDDHTARHTGFAVVHRLARKHGIRVRLAGRAAPGGESSGTTAMVALPASLLTEIPDRPLAMAPAAPPEPVGPAPDATSHLTDSRPAARRGPVAAAPDTEVDAAPADAVVADGAAPDMEPEGVPDAMGAVAGPAEYAFSVPNEPVRSEPGPYEPIPDVNQNGYAEPAAVPNEMPSPLPQREPTSLRGPGSLPPLVEKPLEPTAEEAAEQRRAFADDVAAFSAALGPSADAVPEEPDEPEELPEFLPGYRSYTDEDDVGMVPEYLPGNRAFAGEEAVNAEPALEKPTEHSPLEQAHVVDMPPYGELTGTLPPDQPNEGNQVP